VGAGGAEMKHYVGVTGLESAIGTVLSKGSSGGTRNTLQACQA
jgi:hypothetical protein